MQYSDLVILPSKSEAFGYVILEAFQSCKPVFATSVGGITDIITNENGGLLFDYENLGEMIDAINNFSTNRENLVKMGKKGYNSLIESVATIYRNV
jgi:glycosyltransferase involved in cell wall biosynthesis